MARYNESDNSKSTKVVSSSSGFTAGDPIYNTSQGYKRIPDNYQATATYNIDAPKPWLPQNPSAPYRGGVYKVTTRGGSYGKGMATLNNGNVVYVYHKKDAYSTAGETSDVYFRIDDASGNSVVAETQANVATITNNQAKLVSVETLTGGNFVIVWINGGSVSYSIYQQDGTNVVQDLGSGVSPFQYWNHPPVITPMPNGNWILSIRNTGASANEVTYRVWGPTGTAVAAAVTYTGYYDNCRPTPRADNTVFVWNTANAITGERGYSILSSDLQTENVAASVDVGTTGNANQLAQVLDSDNDMHVIWQNNNNLYHLIMDSAGTTFDSATEYNLTNARTNTLYQSGGQPQLLELNSTQLIYASNGAGFYKSGYVVINKNKTMSTNAINFFHQIWGATLYGASDVATLIKVGTKFRWQVNQRHVNTTTKMYRTSKFMGYIEINSDGTIAYQETSLNVGTSTLSTGGYSESGSTVAEISMEAQAQSEVAVVLGPNTANADSVVGLAPSRSLDDSLGTSTRRAYNIICTKDVGVYFIAWQIGSTVYCSKMDANLNLIGETLNLGGIGYNNNMAWGRMNVCQLNDDRFVILCARNQYNMSIVLVEEDLSSTSINSTGTWTPQGSSGSAYNGYSICPIDDDNETWFAVTYINTLGDYAVLQVLDAVAASVPGYNPNNDISSTANISLNSTTTKWTILQALPDGEFMCHQIQNSNYTSYYNIVSKTGTGISNWTRLGTPQLSADNGTHNFQNDMRWLCKTNYSCYPNGNFSGFAMDTNNRMRFAMSNSYDEITGIDISTYNSNDNYIFGQDGYGRFVACRINNDDRQGAFASTWGTLLISFTSGSQYWDRESVTGFIYGGQIIPQYGSKCFMITNDNWQDADSYIFEITPADDTTFADFDSTSLSIPTAISAERDNYIFAGVALTDCPAGGSGVLQVKGQAKLASTYKDLTATQNFDSRTPTATGAAGSQLGRSVNFIEE